jgi:tetratricopeptide (TPR) repeat protein
LFDDENPEAFERSGMSRGALADLADRLKNGQFTAAELALSRAAAAAVETDEERKAVLQDQLATVEFDALGVGSSSMLDTAARASGVKLNRSKAAKESQDEDTAQPEEDLGAELEEVLLEEGEEAGGTDGDALTEAEEAALDDEKKKKARRRAAAMLGKAKRNPKKASELAKQGMAALHAGKRGEAESLFNQAIAYDHRNGTALMGLSDVYFDRSANNKAVLYAERAVKASPGNGRYRIKLGDAYFKVLRYRDALKQYESAKKSGESRAVARIKKVQDKLGG